MAIEDFVYQKRDEMWAIVQGNEPGVYLPGRVRGRTNTTITVNNIPFYITTGNSLRSSFVTGGPSYTLVRLTSEVLEQVHTNQHIGRAHTAAMNLAHHVQHLTGDDLDRAMRTLEALDAEMGPIAEGNR